VLGRLTSEYGQNDTDSTLDLSASLVGYTYDTNGQLSTATVYYDSLGGTILSQVQEVYNGLGQLIGEYQSHSGAVNTSTTPEVQYSYASLSGSSSDGRPTGMTYPNGRQLDYVYNSGLDNNISRISGLSDHAGSAAGNLESYSYLGLDTIVRRTRGNGTQLTYAPTTVAGGDGGDQYTGLDRFGRVMDQDWINTSTGTAFDRIQYAYDADSNVLYQNNLVNSAYSELFSPDNGAAQNAQYDALNRLLGFARGTLSASHGSGTPLDTVSSPSATEGWTLDALGNWTSFTNGSTTQTRSFNARNEITSISGVSTPTYDVEARRSIRSPAPARLKAGRWMRWATGPASPTAARRRPGISTPGTRSRASAGPATRRATTTTAIWSRTKTATNTSTTSGTRSPRWRTHLERCWSPTCTMLWAEGSPSLTPPPA
jgi:hypothetical protein